MKIALAQTKIIWEDKDENIKRAIKVVEKQSQNGTKLVLFPEMSFTGFSMNTDATKENGKYTRDKIMEAACRNNISIGYGWVKDCGEKCENHYSVIDSNGNVVSDYAKIHPFSYSGEDKYFKGGNKTTVFELDGMKYSVFICYDLRFPEIFQAVSDKVSAIIVPANWPAKRREHWLTLLKARAIENQAYILGVNCIGNIGGTEYTGDSCIVNPDGEMLEMESGREGILSYDLRKDAECYRDKFQVKRDRQWNLYQRLYADKVEEDEKNLLRSSL